MIVYVLLQLWSNIVFLFAICFCHSIKNGQLPIQNLTFLAQHRNNMPDLWDIEPQNDATCHLKKTRNDDFVGISRQHVTESYSHHDSCSPIKCINIFHYPSLILYIGSGHPVLLKIYSTHRQNETSHKVSKHDVRQTHFDEPPYKHWSLAMEIGCFDLNKVWQDEGEHYNEEEKENSRNGHYLWEYEGKDLE